MVNEFPEPAKAATRFVLERKFAAYHQLWKGQAITTHQTAADQGGDRRLLKKINDGPARLPPRPRGTNEDRFIARIGAYNAHK